MRRWNRLLCGLAFCLASLAISTDGHARRVGTAGIDGVNSFESATVPVDEEVGQLGAEEFIEALDEGLRRAGIPRKERGDELKTIRKKLKDKPDALKGIIGVTVAFLFYAKKRADQDQTILKVAIALYPRDRRALLERTRRLLGGRQDAAEVVRAHELGHVASDAQAVRDESPWVRSGKQKAARVEMVERRAGDYLHAWIGDSPRATMQLVQTGKLRQPASVPAMQQLGKQAAKEARAELEQQWRKERDQRHGIQPTGGIRWNHVRTARPTEPCGKGGGR